MDWIEDEALGLFRPGFTDVFIGGKATEGLQAPGEVVSGDEVGEVGAQLLVVFVVVALDGRLLEGSVHPLELAVGPGVGWAW